MTLTRRDFARIGLSITASGAAAAAGRVLAAGPLASRPLAADPQVIALGAAARDAPAWTAEAWQAAIREGADVLFAPLAPTRDGLLVVRGDPELSVSTDVATRPEFTDRRRAVQIEGQERTGWFSEDFTLAELKSLQCGAPRSRRQAAGRQVMSFDELTALARAGAVATGRVIGIEARLLRPGYYASLDMALEPRLADAIRLGGYNSPVAGMTISSPSLESLRATGELTRVRRILRLAADQPGAEDAFSQAGLKSIAGLAWAIAPDAALVLDLTQAKTLPPRGGVEAAHAAGLKVQAWASDGAAPFPPPRRSADARRVLAALWAAGCDGIAGPSAALIARAREDVFPRDRD